MTKNIHLYTGEGAGKTTSVFGVALRAIAHKKHVIIIQFMKGRKDIGEFRIQKKLRPYYEVHQFGSKDFINLKDPEQKHKKLAKKGLEFAKKAAKKKPFLLVLDELGLATSTKLLEKKEVLAFLKSVPKETIVYITGRRNPTEFYKLAKFVTKLTTLKQPKTPEYIKGIEY